VPLSIVESYRLRSHFESGLGVGIQGAMPPGPVTLVRIGGSALERAWIAEGEVVSAGDAEDLCRTQVTVSVDDGEVGELLRAPLGNHLVVVRGRQAARFRAWHDMVRPGAGAA
jgi:L-fucose isomerase-like protein